MYIDFNIAQTVVIEGCTGITHKTLAVANKIKRR